MLYKLYIYYHKETLWVTVYCIYYQRLLRKNICVVWGLCSRFVTEEDWLKFCEALENIRVLLISCCSKTTKMWFTDWMFQQHVSWTRKPLWSTRTGLWKGHSGRGWAHLISFMTRLLDFIVCTIFRICFSLCKVGKDIRLPDEYTKTRILRKSWRPSTPENKCPQYAQLRQTKWIFQ